MRRYIAIAEDIFYAYALENGDGSCDIEDFLDGSSVANREDATLRHTMTNRLANLLKKQLPISGVHHEIEDGIWQISSGKYRLMYFFDEGYVVICTHWFAKKGQKTPPKETRKAKKHREEYLEAKNNKTILFKR